MSKIEDYLFFVKEQVGVQGKLAKKYEDSPYRQSLHLGTGKNFADLGNFLDEIKKRGTQDTSYLNRGDSPQKRISLTYEDIEGAPEELLRELNLTDADRQDLLVEYLIAQAGGFLSLNKIMVELYKRTSAIPTRNTIISRLYRMVEKGMIYNVPGKKGVYSTYEMTEQDAKKMFGELDGEADEASSPAPAPAQAEPPAPTPAKIPTQSDRMRTRFLAGSATAGIRRT